MPESACHPRYFDPTWIESSARRIEADICVYGGTASGVIASVAAAERGRTVILLNPARRCGGMTTGGLGFTDVGNTAVIGGRAREFYRRVGRHYGLDECWKFEPHVAQTTLDQWRTTKRFCTNWSFAACEIC